MIHTCWCYSACALLLVGSPGPAEAGEDSHPARRHNPAHPKRLVTIPTPAAGAVFRRNVCCWGPELLRSRTVLDPALLPPPFPPHRLFAAAARFVVTAAAADFLAATDTATAGAEVSAAVANVLPF